MFLALLICAPLPPANDLEPGRFCPDSLNPSALDTEGCFVKPSVEAARFGAPRKRWKGVHLYREIHMRWAGPDSPGARK